MATRIVKIPKTAIRTEMDRAVLALFYGDGCAILNVDNPKNMKIRIKSEDEQNYYLEVVEDGE